MDGNLPSGESFCRQFLYGQKYFQTRFGKRTDTLILPDTCELSVHREIARPSAGISKPDLVILLIRD